MLFTAPLMVNMGGVMYGNVVSISVERQAAREVVEFGDVGPHVVFADVAEMRTRLVITMDVGREPEGMVSFVPGESLTISFDYGINGGEASRRRVIVQHGVVMGYSYTMKHGKAVARVVEIVAVSSDGSADPVVQMIL